MNSDAPVNEDGYDPTGPEAGAGFRETEQIDAAAHAMAKRLGATYVPDPIKAAAFEAAGTAPPDVANEKFVQRLRVRATEEEGDRAELCLKLRLEVERDEDEPGGPGEVTYGIAFAEAADMLEADAILLATQSVEIAALKADLAVAQVRAEACRREAEQWKMEATVHMSALPPGRYFVSWPGNEAGVEATLDDIKDLFAGNGSGRPAAGATAEEVRVRVIEECVAAAERAGNFGDYRRDELTTDFGQPRFDMMTGIVAALRALQHPIAVSAPPESAAYEGCTCHACGRRYRGDLLVLDEVWEMIKPDGAAPGAGMLCASCIMDRLVRGGIWTAARAYDVDSPLTLDMVERAAEVIWNHYLGPDAPPFAKSGWTRVGTRFRNLARSALLAALTPNTQEPPHGR